MIANDCRDKGGLVGTFSVADLRGMTKGDMPNPDFSVQEFLHHKGTPLPEQAVCKASTSAYDVVASMLGEHIRRVWVVDDAGKPVDAVSTTDIMAKLAPNDLHDAERYA